jgi:hypothetical protein
MTLSLPRSGRSIIVAALAASRDAALSALDPAGGGDGGIGNATGKNKQEICL